MGKVTLITLGAITIHPAVVTCYISCLQTMPSHFQTVCGLRCQKFGYKKSAKNLMGKINYFS